MKMKNFIFALSMTLTMSSVYAAESSHVEELDPYAADINEQIIENEGSNAFSNVMSRMLEVTAVDGEDCHRDTCDVYLEVNRTTQRATLRIDGQIVMDKSGVEKNGEMRVTTGKGKTAADPVNRRTPGFDQHPDVPVRLFSKYSSSKYPGGDWKGFGNMPFVVFIHRGFGVHGTTGDLTWGNISKLGTVPLSHGCIRIHPLNAKTMNEAVRAKGAKKTWIYVHD